MRILEDSARLPSQQNPNGRRAPGVQTIGAVHLTEQLPQLHFSQKAQHRAFAVVVG